MRIPTIVNRMIKSGRFWASVPVALLTSLVGLELWLVRQAIADPSASVEDRYYAKAISWDAKMEQDRTNARLGWRARATVARASKTSAEVTVGLEDPQGNRLSGARVDLSAFAIARSQQIVHSGLPEGAPGQYRATLPIGRAGLWELEFDVQRGADHFTEVVRIDVPSEVGPS